MTFICTNINFTPHFLLEILLRFRKLAILVIWMGLAIPTKINGIYLKDSLMFICMEKVNFMSPLFFEISRRYYKLAIFGNLGMPGYKQ